MYKNHSLPRERLKTILKGSHGHVGISFDIGKPNRLVFCESFIDLMSYYELHQQSLSDVRLVSMEGLKRSVVAYQILRLIAENISANIVEKKLKSLGNQLELERGRYEKMVVRLDKFINRLNTGLSKGDGIDFQK
ncbi:TPA: hypothetical protein V0R15_000764 [Streptococcus pneumoniae]|nr:hypothetical protein DA395_05905 [Streptococcus pneumoniae]OYL02237.1 hypothetical protein AK82_05430 [Streptococcus pneumoniae K2521]MBW5019915.1 hypothetical protein [Streptococcus pneumoniae]MBW5109497.1 hypothetical protein [Streptococcus pneumoniae]MBW5134568.1 hypothetical protein [Streptococcus pneumoniae]